MLPLIRRAVWLGLPAGATVGCALAIGVSLPAIDPPRVRQNPAPPGPAQRQVVRVDVSRSVVRAALAPVESPTPTVVDRPEADQARSSPTLRPRPPSPVIVARDATPPPSGGGRPRSEPVVAKPAPPPPAESAEPPPSPVTEAPASPPVEPSPAAPTPAPEQAPPSAPGTPPAPEPDPRPDPDPPASPPPAPTAAQPVVASPVVAPPVVVPPVVSPPDPADDDDGHGRGKAKGLGKDKPRGNGNTNGVAARPNWSPPGHDVARPIVNGTAPAHGLAKGSAGTPSAPQVVEPMAPVAPVVVAPVEPVVIEPAPPTAPGHSESRGGPPDDRADRHGAAREKGRH